MITLSKFLQLLFKISKGSLIVFSTFYSVLFLWGWSDNIYRKYVPRKYARFEDIVVTEQIKRSNSNLIADILIVGDSSSLMGINPIEIEKKLNRSLKIQNLSTMAFVNPSTMINLVERFIKKNGFPEILILHFNPIVFNDNPGNIKNKDYQFYNDWIKTGFRKNKIDYEIPRLKFLDLVSNLIIYPLPKNYGIQYGWTEDFISYLHDHNGTLIDPGPNLRYSPEEHIFSINDYQMRELIKVKKLINNLGIENVYLAFTPNISIKMNNNSLETRKMTYSNSLKLLGLDENKKLNLPEVLDKQFYVSTHHLNKEGRELLTNYFAMSINEILKSIDSF